MADRITPLNKYPEKPVLRYQRTRVGMLEVEEYLRGLDCSIAIKIAAYVMFRNESANGLSGVNNNYIGAQADNARWDKKFDEAITGTCVKAENKTGRLRRFLCFTSFKTSVDFLTDRVQDRGLFVGGYSYRIAKMHINSFYDWSIAYCREWVTGDAKGTPDDATVTGLVSMCKQGAELFK